MQLNDVKIPTSRSGFDMSSKVCFSAKAGELLPVFCQEMIPSETKEIALQSFSRTSPVTSSAYTRLREYYDFYFVPYSQLWKQWRMFATQMTDNSIYAKDINNSQVTSDHHPYFTLKQVADYIYNVRSQADADEESVASSLNCLGFDRSSLTVKLLEYLGYGDFSPYLENPYAEPSTSNPSFVNVPLNPFPLLAYQKIYQDRYRNTQWEKSAPWTYNVDYITGSGDCQIPLENIDYSTRLSMFDLQYCDYPKDYYMGLQPRSQYGDPAVVPMNISDGKLDIDPNPFFLYSGTGLNESPVITNSQPNPSSGGDPNKAFVNALSSQLEGMTVKMTPTFSIDNSQFANAVSGLNILLLRQYEMLQKYREVMQSTDTDYKSQIEKLFGVSLDWHDSNQVRWLGGIARNFDISEVVNTNLTEDTEKAQTYIQGKGVSVSDGKVRFSTQGDYGLVICIYHVVPLLDYSLHAPLKLNTKYRFTDYAQPAFDRLGLQSIPALELFNSPALIQWLLYNGKSIDDLKSSILGYGPRYLDYKTQIDRVVGKFNVDLKNWVAPIGDEFWFKYQSPTVLTPDAPDVSTNFGCFFDYTFFKVNPAILNSIFGVAVTSNVNTDQFLVNAFFDVKDVKNLDYDGMPY